MKQSLLIILVGFLLFSTSLLQAQTKSVLKTRYQQLIKQNANIMLAIEERQTAKFNTVQRGASKVADVMSERLIASSGYDFEYNLGLTDSDRYVFSGNRSSSYDFNNMRYPTTFYEWSGAYPIAIVENNSMYFHDNVPGIMCDSLLLYHFNSADTSQNYQESVTTVYDANNNVSQYYCPYLTNPIPTYDANRVINTYDADQHLTETIIFNWNNGLWDTSQKREFAYNGNMITEDSSSVYNNGSWAPESKWSYIYDNAGNIIQATDYFDTSGIWQAGSKLFFFFNNDNILIGDSVSINPWNTNTWIPFVKDSIGYTPGINYVTYKKEIDYGAFLHIEDLCSVSTKHIVAGLPDSGYYFDYILPYNQLLQASKVRYNYDSYNNPVTEESYSFHDTAGNSGYYSTTPDYIFHYYYQTYSSTVNNVVKQQINIKVYPNPATDEINISQTGMQQGVPTYITLINSWGQTVRTESQPWMTNTESLSMAGLSPGNYWLVIQDKNRNVLAQQIIVKK